MPKFKRKRSQNEQQEINTAALPDIVFMLLFFFMVVTVIRTEETPENLQLPKAVELQNFNADEYSHCIFLTAEEDGKMGVWFDNKLATLEGLERGLKDNRDESGKPVLLKSDATISVSDIKKVQETLVNAHAYKIAYAVEKK